MSEITHDQRAESARIEREADRVMTSNLSMYERDKHGALEFKHLAIGDEFVMDRGVENGLIIDLHKPGSYLYRKTSARKMECIGHGDVRFDDPDAVAKLRDRYGTTSRVEAWIASSRTNRSGRVGSITVKVWPR